MKHAASKNLQKSAKNDGYEYFGINAILAAADSHYKFDEHIDDSEEDNISDEELR